MLFYNINGAQCDNLRKYVNAVYEQINISVCIWLLLGAERLKVFRKSNKMWQLFPSSKDECPFRKIFAVFNKAVTDLRQEFQNMIKAFNDHTFNLTSACLSSLFFLMFKGQGRILDRIVTQACVLDEQLQIGFPRIVTLSISYTAISCGPRATNSVTLYWISVPYPHFHDNILPSQQTNWNIYRSLY